VSYDRVVDRIRLVGPGSVGLPYEGRARFAYWGLLGPDVELHRTEYDVEAAVALMRATTDPSVEAIVELMLDPPSPDEVTADAEERVFAG
jgi:diadenosine tetraphosphatase ApaH/serine/threonine PP2A family protein phosphatase